MLGTHADMGKCGGVFIHKTESPVKPRSRPKPNRNQIPGSQTGSQTKNKGGGTHSGMLDRSGILLLCCETYKQKLSVVFVGYSCKTGKSTAVLSKFKLF